MGILLAAYVAFCVRYADQCQPHPGYAEADKQTLTQINAQVNAAILPLTDADHYGVEDYWTIPGDGYGDCEDYALTKQAALLALHYRSSLAVVITRNNERHVVLVSGGLVLDNLTGELLPEDRTGFIWLEKQDDTSDLPPTLAHGITQAAPIK